MLYSFPANVLFVHVSRTGGVSVQSCLRIGQSQWMTLGSSQHAALCEARLQLGELYDTTFKFSVVRNPWDRLVSWYAFLQSISLAPDLDGRSLADPDADHWTEFDAYLDATLKENWIIDGVERPVMSQFHQLSDSKELLLTDGLARFENLANDVSRILHEANLRCPPLPRMNQSHHLHYSVYYSDYGRQLVGDVLKHDIDRFSYRFESEVGSEQLHPVKCGYIENDEITRSLQLTCYPCDYSTVNEDGMQFDSSSRFGEARTRLNFALGSK